MDNTTYVGLSKQILLQRELDIVANNLANVDTTGFKVEGLTTATDTATPARTIGVNQPVQFAVDNGVARDFSQGGLQQTGAPLDLAIQGRGFFQVQAGSATAYTRDGRFATDSQGQLVTQDGNPVLGASGSPIILNPQGGPPAIGRDGTVTQMLPGQTQAQVVGQIGVVDFADMSVLSKQGGGLYTNTTNVPPTPAPDATIKQGMLEASNVQPIIQVTELIRINRAYAAMAQMMSDNANLSDSAIQKLGSVQ
jgi:flagellar basal-body rod protein FlgF